MSLAQPQSPQTWSAVEFACHVLHELSQSTTALICALELSSLHERRDLGSDQRDSAQEIARGLQGRIVRFRRVADVLSASSHASTLQVCSPIAAVWESLRELAASMDARLEFACDNSRVTADECKLTLALTYLLDAMIGSRRGGRIALTVADHQIGHICVEYVGSEAPTDPGDAVYLASLALRSMGAELMVCGSEPRLEYEIALQPALADSQCQPLVAAASGNPSSEETKC